MIVLRLGAQNPDQAVAEFNPKAACEKARDHIRVKFPDACGAMECFAKGEPP